MSLKTTPSTFSRLLHSTRDVFKFTGLEVMESDNIHSGLGFWGGYGGVQETSITAIA